MAIRHALAVPLANGLLQKGIKVDARGSYLRLCGDILNTEHELERVAHTLGELVKCLGVQAPPKAE